MTYLKDLRLKLEELSPSEASILLGNLKPNEVIYMIDYTPSEEVRTRAFKALMLNDWTRKSDIVYLLDHANRKVRGSAFEALTAWKGGQESFQRYKQKLR